jgi:hypothetical protein
MFCVFHSKLIPLSDSIDYASKGDGSIGPIRDKVGKLRYLADRVRPDLLTSVGILGSAADNPTVKHLQGVKHLADTSMEPFRRL